MLALWTITAFAAPTAVGEITVEGKTLFKIEHFESPRGDGVVNIRRRTLDASGKLAYEVHAELARGLQRSMVCNHPQRKLTGKVTFEAGRVLFERTDPDGSITRNSVRVSGPVMSAPGLVAFMQKTENWQRLLSGQTVPFTYASWSRQSTYGFRLKKSDRSTHDHLVIVMQPSSWFIRQVIPNMFYTYSTKTRRLLRYRGRVSVKKVEADGGLSDINLADVSFTYPRSR